ncbi:HpcH/HpaI aldolase/citrate lyase family protein [Streptomyces heilongjiangensis]|uniref:HpcH/HpaI aldolase/citrate lyase family protein n=1 Tax=Streptomyces heilongjiangensis TaxID=945052 RepID=A0ABW1BBG2_9ACTN|nr:CoA ester lyase [Streptomyces heilongjiangensis]MDC2951157.1 CoA ester lyase [Streptomyces heilongjiangensis]
MSDAHPLTEDVAVARTFLFVPGDRPDRFGKAAACGADVVILDLEDAVAPDRKEEARGHVAAWLDAGNQAVVRVNGAGTAWYGDDLAALAGRTGVVMVPKAEDPAELARLVRTLPVGTGILPLIETAAGIVGAVGVCAAPSVVRAAFGSVDLAAQLGVEHTSHDALRHARSALVLAAAAAGRPAPVDGVTTDVRDETVLRADLGHAVALGYGGKLCVHPRQVPLANEGFSPTREQVSWARDVVAAAGDGSVTVVDGQMVDRPVLLRARAVLARAVPAGAGSPPARGSGPAGTRLDRS